MPYEAASSCLQMVLNRFVDELAVSNLKVAAYFVKLACLEHGAELHSQWF